MNAFPNLKEGGVCVGDSGGQRNTLQLIPSPPEGYTVNYVKEVVRQAKVYIHPVQRNLSLQPKPSQSDIVSFFDVCKSMTLYVNVIIRTETGTDNSLSHLSY